MENSLKQYLDLYRQHKELLCGKSAAGFNLLRDEACRNLEVTGMPRKGTENYEVIDIPAMIAPDYGINIARVPLDFNVAEGFKCGLPHISSALFFQLNDFWAESKGARTLLPEGVEIGPLSRYMGAGGEALEYYGRIADLANPIVALDTMLVQDGVYIRVKKGVKVEKPIQFVNLLESTLPLMAVRRLLVIVEEDAELKLLMCDHTSSPNLDMANVNVAEVFAGRNAKVDIYDMEESTPHTRRLSALYASLEEGSDVLIDGITLRNGMTRNEYHATFNGPGASLRLYGMGIENGARVLDNYSHIRHCAKECHTDELFKYILEDDSRGAFTGRIYVAPGAEKTEAYQSNRNMLGSSSARMFSKPQLEIYNDDVKCSHGSATGRMDPMQMFYMRQRGLSEEEAGLLLKQAFMADVIDSVRLPILKDRLRALVEKHFLGEEALCGDCDAACKTTVNEN